jgi:hypothetical protein
MERRSCKIFLAEYNRSFVIKKDDEKQAGGNNHRPVG